jgi:hypothetical protein
MGVMPPWSYTALTAHETCPRRYYLTRVAKQVIEPQTEATIWGNRVHNALEKRAKGEAPLPPELQQYEKYIEKILSREGKRIVEQRMTIDRNFRPTDWGSKTAWCRGIVDIGVVGSETAYLLDWKGLALDTELPTPSGWTTMRDVKVGDVLFGADGRPCSVVGKSDVHYRDCYRLTFDDTTTVVCDDEHLWEVNGEVLPTAEIAKSLIRYGQKWRAVRLAAPLETCAVDLPIHPYVLGLWLGDGKHTSGEICKPDEFVWEKVRSLGYELSSDASSGGRTRAHTVYGIRGHLGDLGVLRNKHIPAAYLRASVAQRVELLRGLMDSDGNANPTRKQAVFTTCSKQLSDDVIELLCSLGQRPLQSSTRQSGFGKVVTAYPISFRPQNGLNPFSLPRKAERILPTWGRGHSFRRVIVSAERIPTVPTQCIAVDSPDHTYLCTKKMLVTHNTGKRKVDSDQLKLFAAMAFAHYPWVEKVVTGFIWLKEGKFDKESFTREQVPDIWNEFLPRVKRVELAYEQDKWPAKPSGLCKAWCPAGKPLCEFCGRA